MASMQGRFRPSHSPKPHMLAGTLVAILRRKKYNTMRGLLTILTCILLYQTTFGQFGIISDKDGFVNIRSSAGSSNNIVDTLTNGQIVFCFEAEGEWLPVDYDLSSQNKSGYIHKTRVKFIEHFDNIPYSQLTDSSITFKNDTISLKLTKVSFNSKVNKLLRFLQGFLDGIAIYLL